MFIFTGTNQQFPKVKGSEILKGLIGGTLSIFTLLLLSHISKNLFIMAPFGATCVLLYAVSQSPLAQPRNVILGHFISAFVGLCFLKWFDINLFSIALAVGIAIALMMYFQCVHPPAGANPLVILLTANTIHYDWSFLLFPVLLGSIILVCIAYGMNHLKLSKFVNH